MTTQGSLFGTVDDGPLVLSYGVGVDSTAVLVGWHDRGIRPDLIMFADTGAEHDRTYRYLEMMQGWLAAVGFPPVETVRYRPSHGRYETIVEECILKMVLPSLAYGRKSCSQKWKVAPQQRYLSRWQPAIEEWSRGARIRNAIGYDAGPKDIQRGTENVDTPLTKFVFPLREWGWDRTRCETAIASCESLANAARKAGIPVSPGHSSCICCPSIKPAELEQMQRDEPENLGLSLAMEAIAMPKLTTFKGLWRRDTEALPASWNAYARSALPDATPTNTKRLGSVLAPLESAPPPPPPGMDYATGDEERGYSFHRQFGDALRQAGAERILVRVQDEWFASDERRRHAVR